MRLQNYILLFLLIFSHSSFSSVCTTNVLGIANVSYTTNTKEVSQESLYTQGSVIVNSGVTVSYTAPVITLASGFYAASDSQFNAASLTVVCPEIQISTNNYLPFQPITINTNGISLNQSDTWSVYFNNVAISSVEIDLMTGDINTLIPNIPGLVTLKIVNQDGLTSNTLGIYISDASLPEGITVEEVEQQTVTKINEFTASLAGSDAALSDLNQEQLAALTDLDKESASIREISMILLDDLSAEEHETLAIYMTNSGFLLNGDTQTAAYKTASSFDTSNLLNFTPSFAYERILVERRIAESNNKYSTLLNFGDAAYFTPLAPPVATILKIMDISLALQKATLWQPAILSDFTVTMPEPAEGIYRNTLPMKTEFIGTFVGVYSQTEAVGRALQDLAWIFAEVTPLKRTILKEKFASIGDGLITNAFKAMLDAEFDINQTKNEIGVILNKLQDVKSLDNIKFNPSDFGIHPTQKFPAYYPQNAENKAFWDISTHEVEPLKPGRVEMTFNITDNLRPESDHTVADVIKLEVLNHLPEITNAPVSCIVDIDGECSFNLVLTDEDDELGKLIANIETGPEFGTASGDLQTGFIYQYNANQPPISEDIVIRAKTGESVGFQLKGNLAGVQSGDNIVVKYGDPWEHDTTDIKVNLDALFSRTIRYVINSQPTKGTLDESALFSGLIKYTANDGAEGIDSFTYSILDYINGQVLYSSSSTVTIIINEEDNGCNGKYINTINTDTNEYEYKYECYTDYQGLFNVIQYFKNMHIGSKTFLDGVLVKFQSLECGYAIFDCLRYYTYSDSRPSSDQIDYEKTNSHSSGNYTTSRFKVITTNSYRSEQLEYTVDNIAYYANRHFYSDEMNNNDTHIYSEESYTSRSYTMRSSRNRCVDSNFHYSYYPSPEYDACVALVQGKVDGILNQYQEHPIPNW